MSNGIVYILTNPCLDGWVKIGMTGRDGIEKRLYELNAPPNIPLSYRCYATYEVDDPLDVEKNIHSLIDQVDGSLHAREQLDNGRIREREFFKISPEKAYGIFRTVAKLRNDIDRLKLNAPTLDESQEQEIAESKTKRSNNSFALIGVPVGDEIAFVYDESIIARVANDKNQVEFEGHTYSVTALAKRILIERYGWSKDLHVNGWRYFMKNGVTLSDLRAQIESTEADD